MFRSDWGSIWRNSEIWLNGVLIRSHIGWGGGYTSFSTRLDNVSSLKYGSADTDANILAVWVDARLGSGWWCVLRIVAPDLHLRFNLSCQLRCPNLRTGTRVVEFTGRRGLPAPRRCISRLMEFLPTASYTTQAPVGAPQVFPAYPCIRAWCITRSVLH